MTEWSDAIKNAIVVVIIVVVVGIIFGFVYMAMQSNQEGQEKLSDQLSSFDEKSFGPFDGTTVTGQQVVSAIQQYSGTNVGVTVKTSSGARAFYCRAMSAAAEGAASVWELVETDPNTPTFASSSDHTGSADTPTTIASATDKSYKTYINPNAKFTSTLHRNANGVIVGIEFAQQ